MSEFQYGLVVGLVMAVVFHWLWQHYQDAVKARGRPYKLQKVEIDTKESPAQIMQAASAACFWRAVYFVGLGIAFVVFLFIFVPTVGEQVVEFLIRLISDFFAFLESVLSG